MSQTVNFRTDQDLLALARSVLSKAGYIHKEVPLESESVLLAENAYSIIALVAIPTMADLIAAEPLVESLLHSCLAEADVGPKIWDAYLVLLTQERPVEQGEEPLPLFDINYDTQRFRRIARAGVEATHNGVRNALISFVEPVRLDEAGLTVDPLEVLALALVACGVDESVATRAVEIYQQGGQLDDAL